MTTTYPGTIDTFTNPASTDTLASVDHAAQHDNINDAVKAVETTLGTNPQGSFSTVAARVASAESLTRIAGKNAIINGDFKVWQRGTTFTPAILTVVYTADRFSCNRDGTGATVTVSQQAFTPGTAPVAGYEAPYFYRYAQTVAGSGGTYTNVCSQRIEDVRTYAGQTITMSFWAKADSARTLQVQARQSFGSGGSADNAVVANTFTLSTSWTRYSVSLTLASISGKTIGTGSWFGIEMYGGTNTTQTFDIWGVQVEPGTVATGFSTATGTLQGELAACQRYCQSLNVLNPNGVSGGFLAMGAGIGPSSGTEFAIPLKVNMRAVPSSVTYNSISVSNGYTTNTAATITISNHSTSDTISLSGGVAGTLGAVYWLATSAISNAYILWSAEL